MEIHGGLPQGFSTAFDAGGLVRSYNTHQHLGQSSSAYHHGHPMAHLNSKRGRDTLSLKLEPEPLPECLGTLLDGHGSDAGGGMGVHSPLLGSPEMNLLKLGSPELERLIMTQQGEDGCSSIGSNSSGLNSIKIQHHHLSASANSKDATHYKNPRGLSPLISVKDLQFITETNEALESILPKSHHYHQHHHHHNAGDEASDSFEQRYSMPYEMETFMEPLQQVPGSFGNESSMQSSTSQINKRPPLESTVAVSDAFSTQSYSPVFREKSAAESGSIMDRLSSDPDRMFDGNSGMIYDLNQPTMVPSRFRHASGMETKDPQPASGTTAAFNMLPLPPIDLEVQEIVKRERKKLKNRVAASKCRKKKLEREAQLEMRVQQLKDKNIELNALANALRQQSTELKQRILEHINAGCHTRAVHY
eukprot:gene11961-13198_t